MLSSPAVRALTTATIMARELKVPAEVVGQDERLYLASPADLLAVVRDLGGHTPHLMVFGHNPGITDFANRLSAGEHMDNMPTCAVFTATFDLGEWSELDWGGGQDVEFDYPGTWRSRATSWYQARTADPTRVREPISRPR